MTHATTPLRIPALRLPPLPRSDRPELMDGVIADHAELAGNLRDIRRVNRLLGGISTVTHHLPGLIAGIPRARAVTVLDLATGSADIPLALLDWAAARGRRFEILATDSSEGMLAIAREQVRGAPGITLARHDARAVSLPDRSFDLVLCSLALHHLVADDATHVLREMARLARVGFIVNDLRRERIGLAAAWLAARATTRNRLTRHDAPLSVRRAFTPAELRALLAAAGIRGATVTTHPWFRMAAVWRVPHG